MTQVDGMSHRSPVAFAALVLAGCLAAAGCGGGEAPSPLVCDPAPDPVGRPAPPDRPDAVDYLVIAADPLVEAARTHASYRERRGRLAEVIALSELLAPNETDRARAIESMRAAVAARRAALEEDRTLFVLLLGDASEDWSGSLDEVPAAEVGGWLWAGRVTSDNVVADLDDDHLPDVALGRVPARSATEAEAMLARTREVEAAYEPGPWATRVHVFASEAGFGEVVDAVLEQAGFAAVAEVPRDWELTFTYARPGSPYAYPPARFSDQVYDLLSSGSVLVTYIGHGWEEGFTSVRWNGEVAPILDATALGSLDMRRRVPLLLFIACLTGSFDTGDSLSERFLREPGGPVAIVASTEISHPYANGVMTREIAQTMLVARLPTAGEVFTEARRRMLTRAGDPVRLDLDELAVVDETTRTPELREDLLLSHQHMYVLLGDPAHEVAYPAGSVELSLESAEVVAGEPVRACVQVRGPPEGRAVATLEIERDAIGSNLERWAMDDPDRDETVVANHALANDKVFERWEGEYRDGGFTVALPTDAAHVGRVHLRVYAWSGELDAVGAAPLRILPPRTPPD